MSLASARSHIPTFAGYALLPPSAERATALAVGAITWAEYQQAMQV